MGLWNNVWLCSLTLQHILTILNICILCTIVLALLLHYFCIWVKKIFNKSLTNKNNHSFWGRFLLIQLVQHVYTALLYRWALFEWRHHTVVIRYDIKIGYTCHFVVYWNKIFAIDFSDICIYEFFIRTFCYIWSHLCAMLFKYSQMYVYLFGRQYYLFSYINLVNTTISFFLAITCVNNLYFNLTLPNKP